MTKDQITFLIIIVIIFVWGFVLTMLLGRLQFRKIVMSDQP